MRWLPQCAVAAQILIVYCTTTTLAVLSARPLLRNTGAWTNF